MEKSNLIKYYRDCFISDNRELTIDNFFSSKVENRKIIEGQEEILTNMLFQLPVDDEYAENIEKIISVYKKEKSLIYSSLFIVGTDLDENSKQKICAPLVYYQAEIVRDENLYFIEIDKKHPTINFSILKKISENFSENEDIHNQFIEFFSNDKPDFDFSTKLISILASNVPELKNHFLLDFPKLLDENEIKQNLDLRKLKTLSGYSIIPASGIGIIKKSSETLGIINELEELSKSEDFSIPLKSIFFDKKIFFHPEKRGQVPSVLNIAQENIIENFPKYPFSLIVGPPGTGKSYTIANLAIEQMSKGKSVLICSKTDQAVDIIADKIENHLKINDVIVRAGRKEYLKELKIKLENILNNIHSQSYDKISDAHTILSEIKQIEKNISKLEKNFSENIESEVKWGNFIAEKHENPSFFENIKIKYKKYKNSKDKKLWEIIEDLYNLYKTLNIKTIDYVEKNFGLQLFLTLKNHRSELLTFQKGIKSRTGGKQEDLFNSIDFKVLLKTFPIWLVKLSDIYKVLPLQTELFDLAIIDESTQCDIASCLPIIQRAKKVVFTGDPHQLRHVSFIAFSNQSALQQKYNLNQENDNFNYRENSILDVVNSTITEENQIFFLDEHFRSVPAIINFSNKKFYSNALRIMTNRPENISSGLEFVNLQGERNQIGYNNIEAEAILDKIKQIIDEEKDLSAKNCRSIGILSPFRAQVEHISNLIFQRIILPDIEKHNILINTAYGFQGDERDIMLLSFCLDNNSHSIAYHHLNKKDVFNVSITRARSEQFVYYSFDFEKIRKYDILYDYFKNHENAISQQFVKEEKDKFALDLIENLKTEKYNFHSAFNIAGLEIDLLVNNNKNTIGIDLIGYPGEYNESFTIERYKLLQRTGIKILPLPFSSWHFDKENCIAEIKKWLE